MVFVCLVLQLKIVSFIQIRTKKTRGKSFHKAVGCQPEELSTQMTFYVILVEAASSAIQDEIMRNS